MPFDIMSEAVTDTADCELTKADGSPMLGDRKKPCSITFHGPSTPQYAEMQARQRKRMQDRVLRNKGDKSIEQEWAERAEDLAGITASFNNFTFPGEFASPAEMFKACYLERKIGFVVDQANAFVSDWGNFSGGSAKP